MRSSGRMLLTCLAVLVLGPVLAMGNGLYTPTVGARANAMGGAFVGLADDYSAVYWNPAGITQIKGMELTVTGQDVATMASREGFVQYEGLEGSEDLFQFAIAEVGATSDAKLMIAPGLFFYTDPGPLRAIVDKVGIAAYTLTEYGVKWDGSDVIDGFVSHDRNYDWISLSADQQDYDSSIRSYSISPVVAKEVIPGLSIGLTGNFVYSHYKVADVVMVETPVVFEQPEGDFWVLALTPLQFEDDVTAWGYGATFGALYRFNRETSVGLTVRSPMNMKYDGTYGFMASATTPDTSFVYEESHDSTFELRYPTWAGVGVARRDFMFDGLTLAVDVQWTDWSTFEKINRDVDWGSTETPEEEQDELVLTQLKWEDTVEVAVGFDYRLSRSISLHMGYRNSPSPVPDDTYDFVMPFSSKNTIGLGCTIRQDFWRASIGLEYQAGDERNVSGTDDMNGKHVEDTLVPSLSFTYAF